MIAHKIYFPFDLLTLSSLLISLTLLFLSVESPFFNKRHFPVFDLTSNLLYGLNCKIKRKE